jgi:hypothetical protein
MDFAGARLQRKLRLDHRSHDRLPEQVSPFENLPRLLERR